MDDVDGKEGGGAPVEEVSVGGGAPVEEVSVGGGAPVDVVGIVAPEVLLSEKQVNAHNLIHQQMSTQLTNDKLKHLQWLDC